MSDEPSPRDPDGAPLIPGFAIERPLGKGGMGTVWLATDQRTQGKVALKVLPAEADSDLHLRFDREALIGRRLRHPDIVTFYDAGRAPDALWIAMEYLDGFELTRAMHDPGFGFEDRLLLLIRVAMALDHAHQHGVIHRDIKPSNIFMTRDGGVRLLDFGIARTGDAQQKITQTNRTMGTPRYMAPEQVMGTAMDGRADLFALALVAYELFAGTHPWEANGRSPTLLYLAVLASAPAPLTQTFLRSQFAVGEDRIRALAEVIHRALAAQPEQRQASAQQFAEELEAVRSGTTGDTATQAVTVSAIQTQALAERRIEWARARAARLVMEGQGAPQPSMPPPATLESRADRRSQTAWVVLVTLFGIALVAALGWALSA